MGVIRIDPGVVQGTGTEFNNMSQEVAGLVNRAKTVMTDLQTQFTGTRATNIFREWGDMLPSLDAAIRSLESAGQLLSKAADDFSTVDMR